MQSSHYTILALIFFPDIKNPKPVVWKYCDPVVTGDEYGQIQPMSYSQWVRVRGNPLFHSYYFLFLPCFFLLQISSQTNHSFLGVPANTILDDNYPLSRSHGCVSFPVSLLACVFMTRRSVDMSHVVCVCANQNNLKSPDYKTASCLYFKHFIGYAKISSLAISDDRLTSVENWAGQQQSPN